MVLLLCGFFCGCDTVIASDSGCVGFQITWFWVLLHFGLYSGDSSVCVLVSRFQVFLGLGFFDLRVFGVLLV